MPQQDASLGRCSPWRGNRLPAQHDGDGRGSSFHLTGARPLGYCNDSVRQASATLAMTAQGYGLRIMPRHGFTSRSGT